MRIGTRSCARSLFKSRPAGTVAVEVRHRKAPRRRLVADELHIKDARRRRPLA